MKPKFNSILMPNNDYSFWFKKVYHYATGLCNNKKNHLFNCKYLNTLAKENDKSLPFQCSCLRTQPQMNLHGSFVPRFPTEMWNSSVTSASVVQEFCGQYGLIRNVDNFLGIVLLSLTCSNTLCIVKFSVSTYE